MKKMILTIAMATMVISAFAQTQVVDKFGNLMIVQKGLEPWRLENTITEASSNTQNVYQQGNVGIGNFSATKVGAKFEILGGGRNQLRLSGSATGSKWDFSSESGALTFTSRSPGNIGRKMNLLNNGSLSLGGDEISAGMKSLSTDTQEGDFFYDSDNSRLVLGNGAVPSQKLDVNGNVRIRNMSNANRNTAYTRNVVSDANGILGYSERTSDYAPVTYTAVINDGWTSTGKSADDFYPNVIGLLRAGAIFDYLWRINNGIWEFNFDKLNSTNNASIQVIWLRK